MPAWRRLGGWFSAALLLVFMAYVAINYEPLRGADCSCFPWVKRAVGPVFFWTDGAMVALALLAAWFSRPPVRLRQAAIALAGIVAMTGVMFADGAVCAPAAAGELPTVIQVAGGQLDITKGPVFLYFLNPTCMHCLDAGIAMSKYQWKATFVGIPTQDFDFGPQFVNDASLKNVKLSPEFDRLKAVFPFEDVPYGVALQDGKVVAQLHFFDEPDLGASCAKSASSNRLAAPRRSNFPLQIRGVAASAAENSRQNQLGSGRLHQLYAGCAPGARPRRTGRANPRCHRQAALAHSRHPFARLVRQRQFAVPLGRV